MDEIKKSGFDSYFVDHTTGIYPAASSGVPYSAATMQVKGDIITDIHENLAAEQKARSTYDNILRFCDDPDVIDPIRFLRAREVVHYQRFGDSNRINYNKFIYSTLSQSYQDIPVSSLSELPVPTNTAIEDQPKSSFSPSLITAPKYLSASSLKQFFFWSGKGSA